MDEAKRQNVRKAAMEVFLRYGYRKVTMEDIALGARMSRPALYLIFPNKEAVFRDLVQAGLDDLIEKIEAGLPNQPTPAEKLFHVFEASTVASFELVARAPAAQELMHASFDFVKDLFNAYEQRLTEILVRLLHDAVRAPESLRPSAQARARIMIAAVHGFKASAKDAQEMRTLVADLVAVILAGLPVNPLRQKPASGSKHKKRTP